MKKLLQETPKDIIIISSSPDSFIREILESNEIKKSSIYGKELAKTKKERFEMLLSERKISKDDIIYIGDTVDDYLFCKQVGVSMIGLNYGYSNLTKIKDSLLDLKEHPVELVESIRQYMLFRRKNDNNRRNRWSR